MQEKSSLVHPAGAQVFCPNCGELYCYVIKDVYSGDPIEPGTVRLADMSTPVVGQRMDCKTCGSCEVYGVLAGGIR